MMKRFWFEFKFDNMFTIPPGLSLGCGVTALNLDDARNIIKDKIFHGSEIPEIKTQIENIDVSTLDPGHILPNMLPPDKRGVWFPIGLSDSY